MTRRCQSYMYSSRVRQLHNCANLPQRSIGSEQQAAKCKRIRLLEIAVVLILLLMGSKVTCAIQSERGRAWGRGSHRAVARRVMCGPLLMRAIYYPTPQSLVWNCVVYVCSISLACCNIFTRRQGVILWSVKKGS